jgi:hypothetical protein
VLVAVGSAPRQDATAVEDGDPRPPQEPGRHDQVGPPVSGQVAQSRPGAATEDRVLDPEEPRHLGRLPG